MASLKLEAKVRRGCGLRGYNGRRCVLNSLNIFSIFLVVTYLVYLVFIFIISQCIGISNNEAKNVLMGHEALTSPDVK